ncbi:MAG: UDP-glucuronic acid decarboxylase family protein [Gemmatimonadota bacterium]|nr:UDP-glucuronic acid decarboxylase family protein [Gemmatimonadota bacterium]
MEDPLRIVVTGGSGFLGSHLCDRLLTEGHEVVGIDNFITGRKSNIEHITSNRFEFIEHDVSKYIDIQGPVDFVMHLASPASPIDFERFPIQILKVGALGTHNALGLAKAKKAGFFIASTSEVYGDPLVNPQPESYWGNVNPVGIRGVYDEAKRFAEAMTMAYHRIHGIDTRIVRIFNTYGPRMRPKDGRVMPTFIYQSLRGEPLTVFGEGQQTRSFCYYEDLIDGFYRLLLSDENYPVNIGNSNEISMLELAQTIITVTGSTSAIIHKPLPQDDPRLRRPDIGRATRILEWEARVPLVEGLEKTIEYFKAEEGIA